MDLRIVEVVSSVEETPLIYIGFCGIVEFWKVSLQETHLV